MSSSPARKAIRLVPRSRISLARSAYVLFEIILALTIFAAGGLALANAMRSSIDAGASLNHHRHVRAGLETILAEIRTKDLSEMSTTAIDELLGVTYATTLEDAPLQTQDGSALEDLYLLRAIATWEEGRRSESLTAEVLFYRPE